MKLSREWLSQYVEVGEDADVLAKRLTDAGMAVELVEAHGDDVVLDVDVTTNRVDAMNHLGMARELAVATRQELRLPAAAAEPAGPGHAREHATVLVEDPDLCPRYTAHVIRGVKVGPSPGWLRRRLEAIGSRSINNVVDVTNYVLWETGQPLHAFDLAALANATIVVRRAHEGETLTTLDGVERKLDPDMLVIADDRVAVALGGIMGGGPTEVTARTTDVLLECAWFDRASVRRTAKRLGMHTDASHRYERGVDPQLQVVAAARAAALIVEVAGGEVVPGVIEVTSVEHLPAPRTIHLDLRRLDRFAGVAIPAAEVRRILEGLGCRLEVASEHGWRVTPPSWRTFDLELPADLYEEVLRHHGYDAIPPTLPRLSGRDAASNPAHDRRERVREHMAACGYAEAIDWAFHGPEQDAEIATLLPPGDPVRLANPLSERYAVLRRSLLPGLVESARFNQRRGAAAVRLFEVGNLFGTAGEREALGVVAGGVVGTPWQRATALDLFDLKGALESVAGAFGVELEARPAELAGFVAGRTATLHRAGSDEVVGHLGELAAGDLAWPLFAGELLLEALGLDTGDRRVRQPSRFPAVPADLTLTHAVETPWRELADAIGAAAAPELASFALKDRYRGQGVPAGAVNTTIAFLYNAAERSLTQDEVNALQGVLSDSLRARFGWRGEP